MVLNSPNNPTGAIISRENLEEIAALARKYDFTVLSDEIYEALVYDGGRSESIFSLPGMKERTVVINGMSKKFAMTGWRLGWAVGPQELIVQMTKMQENIVACAPLPAQYAGIEALNERTDISYIRSKFQSRRNIICNGINAIAGLRCLKTPATFYAFVDISRTSLDAGELAYRLLDRQRVAVVPGTAYGGDRYKQYIRIAFTRKEEELREALRRIEIFMTSFSIK